MKRLLGVIAGALLLGAGCAHGSAENRAPTGGSGSAGTGGGLSCQDIGARDTDTKDSPTAQSESWSPSDTVSGSNSQLGTPQDTGIGGSASEGNTSEDTSIGSSASESDTFEDTGMGGAGGGGG